MNLFSVFFLLFLALWAGLSLWLSFRQQKHVTRHREEVPGEFSERISLVEHRKAADYTVTKTRFGRLELLAGTFLLLAWTLFGALDAVDRFFTAFNHNALVTGTLVIGTVVLISFLLDIPASLYRTFVIEARYGFNHSTMATFLLDRVKGIVLAALFGIPLVLLVLWFMQSTGKLWWVYAWSAMTLFSLLLTWAFPRFIAPLFNRFETLDDNEVAMRLEALLERTGFSSEGIFVMDGSRRSGHGNAYFTGFGKSKRIVFFDTLLEQLTPIQIEAVLAHELGHFKRRHILKGMLVSSLMTLAGFAILAWLMQQTWFYHGLGVSHPSSHMALILFVMVSPVFTFFIGPLMAWFSRKHEFEADAFAAAESDADQLINALVSLYRENASTLTPDPLYSAFHDSHPPASIRIDHLKQLAN